MRVRPATEEDIGLILKAGLRRSDRVEAQKLGLDPEQALWDSYAMADICAVLDAGFGPIAVGGAARKTLLSTEGYIWLLGTDDIETNSAGFLRETRRFFSLVSKEFTQLENIVDATNYKTIRWLRWLGFTFDNEPVVTALGHKFVRFRRINDV